MTGRSMDADHNVNWGKPPRWVGAGYGGLRWRLWHIWFNWQNAADMLNRRVDVENVLLNASAGKRPPLTRDQCRVLAMYLGDPTTRKLILPAGVDPADGAKHG